MYITLKNRIIQRSTVYSFIPHLLRDVKLFNQQLEITRRALLIMRKLRNYAELTEVKAIISTSDFYVADQANVYLACIRGFTRAHAS